MVGWLGATAIFVGLTLVVGIPTEGDARVSVFSAWALAHGHFSCGYPPGGISNNLAAPLYPLLSGGLSALLRIGHSVPFPSQIALGPHCSTAFAAMDQWAQRSGAWRPTLQIGFLGWIALMAGAIVLLRASGRGRCGWEPTALVILALAPPISMCLTEYFHPQDLLAMGLALGGLASVRRKRWIWAGLLLGLAIISQQFALLFLAPLIVVVPKNQRVRFIGAVLLSWALVAVPVVVFTSGRAIASTLVGTGGRMYSISWLDQTGLHPPLLFVVARFLPFALALVLAWWAEKKFGPTVLEPVPFISLIATSLCMRLVFEVNLYGYYFMAIAVLLILLDVLRGRIRVSLVVWLVAVGVASYVTLTQGTSKVPILCWQAVLVGSALALAASPLISMKNLSVRNETEISM